MKNKILLLLLSMSFMTQATVLNNYIGNSVNFNSVLDSGNVVFHTHVPKPAGATTQFLSFEFESTSFTSPGGGFFSNSPNSHIAIGLRGEIVTEPSLQGGYGRGIILGHSHDRPDPDGCDMLPWIGGDGVRPGSAQVELFTPSSSLMPSIVYKSTCGPLMNNASGGLRDNVRYRVTVHANDNGWIAYWIEVGSSFGFFRFRPDNNHVIQVPFAGGNSIDLDGIFIGSVRLNEPQGADWNIEIKNINYGWF